MEFSQIQYFSRLYETLNYARAAEDLFVTRQALHKCIRNMEREVGRPLFDNVKNSLVPTSAGRALYEASRTAMRGFAEIDAAVAAMRFETGSVKTLGRALGVDEAMTVEERRAIARIDEKVNEPLPFSLRTHHCTSDQVRALVVDGTFDYGMYVGDSVDLDLFDAEVGRSGSYHLVVAADDPLAERGSARIADLKGRPLATQGLGFDPYRQIAAAAHRAGFELNVVYSSPSIAECMGVAATGRAVTYSLQGPDGLQPGSGLVAIPFEDALLWRLFVIAKKGLGDPYLLRYFSGQLARWGVS